MLVAAALAFPYVAPALLGVLTPPAEENEHATDGGTCQLRGCDPTTVLRRGAEVVDAARLLHGKGIADPGLRIDWPSLMRFKLSFTAPVPANKENTFAESGIVTYKGHRPLRHERRLRGRR